MLKVRQIYPACAYAALAARFGPPKAVVGKALRQVAKADLRSVFCGKSRQAIRAASRADSASDPDHDERVKGEAIAIVHDLNVRCLFAARQGQVWAD